MVRSQKGNFITSNISSSSKSTVNAQKEKSIWEKNTRETKLNRETYHLMALSLVQDNPAEHKVLYEFPHYFRYLFNMAFLLLISPFWVTLPELKITKNTRPAPQSAFQIKTHSIQMILCGLCQGIGLLFCINGFCQKINGHVTDEPEQIFVIANFILWSLYVFLYIKLSWSKNTLKLFEFRPTQPSRKVKNTCIRNHKTNV